MKLYGDLLTFEASPKWPLEELQFMPLTASEVIKGARELTVNFKWMREMKGKRDP